MGEENKKSFLFSGKGSLTLSPDFTALRASASQTKVCVFECENVEASAKCQHSHRSLLEATLKGKREGINLAGCQVKGLNLRGPLYAYILPTFWLQLLYFLTSRNSGIYGRRETKKQKSICVALKLSRDMGHGKAKGALSICWDLGHCVCGAAVLHVPLAC